MARIAKRSVLLSVFLAAMATWVIGCSGGEGSGDLVAEGSQLYAQNCQSCHGDVATGAGRSSTRAPSHGPSGHTWHHADGQIVDIVLGRFTYPGKEMPSFAGTLTDRQVQSILAYIKVGWNEEMHEYQAEVNRGWEELNR